MRLLRPPGTAMVAVLRQYCLQVYCNTGVSDISSSVYNNTHNNCHQLISFTLRMHKNRCRLGPSPKRHTLNCVRPRRLSHRA